MNSYRLQANAPNPNPSPNPWLRDFGPDHGFNSEAELVEAMSDARYSAPGQEGEHFRELVTLMLKQSDFSGELTTNEAKEASRKSQVLLDEDKQILREHAASLFNDPRYCTSALFRRQVREQIEAHPHLADMIVPQGPSVKKFRLQLSEADMLEARKNIEEERKAAFDQQRKEAIEAATRDAEQRFIDVGAVGTQRDDE